MIHLLDKRPTAKPPNHLSTRRAWCGREYKYPLRFTDRLPAVTCHRCQDTFAKVLSELPDALKKAGVTP